MWNVSLAQYDIELTPHAAVHSARAPPVRSSLQLHPRNRLCAAYTPPPGAAKSGATKPGSTKPGAAKSGGASGACRWSRAFAAPLAFVYLLDTSRGTHELLQFAVPTETDGAQADGVFLLVPPAATQLVPARADAADGHAYRQPSSGAGSAGALRALPQQREASPLLPLLPILPRVLPARMSNRPSSAILPRIAAPIYSHALPSPPMLPSSPPLLGLPGVPEHAAADLLLSLLDKASFEELMRAVESKILMLLVHMLYLPFASHSCTMPLVASLFSHSLPLPSHRRADARRRIQDSNALGAHARSPRSASLPLSPPPPSPKSPMPCASPLRQRQRHPMPALRFHYTLLTAHSPSAPFRPCPTCPSL
jgi:hypothetical protein